MKLPKFNGTQGLSFKQEFQVGLHVVFEFCPFPFSASVKYSLHFLKRAHACNHYDTCLTYITASFNEERSNLYYVV